MYNMSSSFKKINPPGANKIVNFVKCFKVGKIYACYPHQDFETQILTDPVKPGMLYNYLRYSLIQSLSKSSFMEISLGPRHALMV